MKNIIFKVFFFYFFLVLTPNLSLAQVIQLGSGTNVTGTQTSSPINIYYKSNHCQIVYTASELQTTGVYGGLISKVGFYINSVPIHSLPNFTIKIKHTTASDVSGYDNGIFQMVYHNSNYTPQAGGFDMLTLDSLFYWNGIDNIVIDLCFDRVPSWNASGTVRYYNSTNGYNYYWSDNVNTCPNSMSSPNNNKPQCMMEFVGGIANDDAGIVSVNVTSNFCNGIQPISAKLVNYGTSVLDSVRVNWSINDTLQPIHYLTTSLDTFGGVGNWETSVSLGNYNFQLGQTYEIKAWTSFPNGVVDTVAINDSSNIMVSPGLQGSYTIGLSNSDYPTIDSAISHLASFGVCAPVVFNIKNGVYPEQLIIPEISGADSINTITFQSELGDSSLVRISNAGSSLANYTLLLDGADWVRFRNITIEATGASYGKVVVLEGEANHNTFSNNLLKGYNTNSTSSNHAIIYSAGDVDEYNQFLNNRIENGSQGINIRGLNTSNLEKGTIIENNLFINQYYQGIYLSEQDAPQIKNNIIQPKLGYSSTQGMYLHYCDNELQVNNNQIIGAKSYGLYFRYCDANSINRGLISNNFVFTDGSSGNIAVYFYRSYYHNFYNNTVNNTSTSSGAYAFFNDRGHFNIKNNIFKVNNGTPFYTSSSSYINEIDYNNY